MGAYSARVSAKPVPAKPASVSTSKISSTAIKVYWRSVSGATKYEVWRASSVNPEYVLIASTSSRYYKNTGLARGVKYSYKVRAYHLEGTAKVYGAYSSVTSRAL